MNRFITIGWLSIPLLVWIICLRRLEAETTYRAVYAAGYSTPHPAWYQWPRSVPCRPWIYAPQEVIRVHRGRQYRSTPR